MGERDVTLPIIVNKHARCVGQRIICHSSDISIHHAKWAVRGGARGDGVPRSLEISVTVDDGEDVHPHHKLASLGRFCDPWRVENALRPVVHGQDGTVEGPGLQIFRGREVHSVVHLEAARTDLARSASSRLFGAVAVSCSIPKESVADPYSLTVMHIQDLPGNGIASRFDV